MDVETSELRDVLDHIWRVARGSREKTRRIRWIESRALCALEGKEDWKDIDLPRMAKRELVWKHKVKDLQSKLEALTEENERLKKEKRLEEIKRYKAEGGEGYGPALQHYISSLRNSE